MLQPWRMQNASSVIDIRSLSRATHHASQGHVTPMFSSTNGLAQGQSQGQWRGAWGGRNLRFHDKSTAYVPLYAPESLAVWVRVPSATPSFPPQKQDIRVDRLSSGDAPGTKARA